MGLGGYTVSHPNPSSSPGYPNLDLMMWPPEAETCRLIIKIPYISCNKLFSNSCLIFHLNYYKYVVLDVHTLLFCKLYVF